VLCSQKLQKNSLKTLFWGFKVIDVNKSKKPITSACHDKQHVCTYLQPFSHYTSQQWQNNVLLEGYPFLTPSFKGNSFTQGHKIFFTINQSFCGRLHQKFHDPSLHHFDRVQGCDKHTHRQMDRQTPRRWLRRVKHYMLLCVKRYNKPKLAWTEHSPEQPYSV